MTSAAPTQAMRNAHHLKHIRRVVHVMQLLTIFRLDSHNYVLPGQYARVVSHCSLPALAPTRNAAMRPPLSHPLPHILR